MSAPEKIVNRAEAIIAALKADERLTLSERDDMIEIMAEARDGTNGLTVDEKTQANSINIANLTYLFIRHILEGRDAGRSGLYRLISDCRWQIVLVVLIVATVIAFRPQLASLIEAAIRSI